MNHSMTSDHGAGRVETRSAPSSRPEPAMPEQFTALHSQALADLSTWTAPSPPQEQMRARMVETLRLDATAMWRHHSRAHFTTSLVVVDADARRVALTLHAKAKRWFQFGGHLEGGDATLEAAALREGLEESGLADLRLLPGLLAVDIHALDGAFGWCTEHLDVRYVAVAVGESLTVSDESDDVRWFDVDALPEDAEPALREAIALACERVRANPGL